MDNTDNGLLVLPNPHGQTMEQLPRLQQMERRTPRDGFTSFPVVSTGNGCLVDPLISREENGKGTQHPAT